MKKMLSLLALCLLLGSAALADQDTCARTPEPTVLMNMLTLLMNDLQDQANSVDTKKRGGVERMSALSVKAQTVRNAIKQIRDLGAEVDRACGLYSVKLIQLQGCDDSLHETAMDIRACQARKGR